MGQFITIILLGLFSLNASASLITFTHEGTGSGTIGGIAFTDADFVVTATGDTDNIMLRDLTGTLYINHDLASISISGVGTFDFITDTRTFVSNSIDLVGFSRAGETGEDLINGPTDSIFSGWDMTTSIGPVSGFAIMMQWDIGDVETTGGVLFYESSSTPAMFTAVVSTVPVPAAIWLFGSGLLALIATMRRKLTN